MTSVVSCRRHFSRNNTGPWLGGGGSGWLIDWWRCHKTTKQTPCKSTQTGKKKISASMWNNMHTSNGYKKCMYALLASPLNWNWSGCVESNSTHNCTYIRKPIEFFYFSRFSFFKSLLYTFFLVLTKTTWTKTIIRTPLHEVGKRLK